MDPPAHGLLRGESISLTQGVSGRNTKTALKVEDQYHQNVTTSSVHCRTRFYHVKSYRESEMLQLELLMKNHHIRRRLIYSMNSTGSQLNGASILTGLFDF